MTSLDSRLIVTYDAVRSGCEIQFRSPAYSENSLPDHTTCDECATIRWAQPGRIRMIDFHGNSRLKPLILGLHGRILPRSMVAPLALDHATNPHAPQPVYQDTVPMPTRGTRTHWEAFSSTGLEHPTQEDRAIHVHQDEQSFALWFGPDRRSEPPLLVDPESGLDIWMTPEPVSKDPSLVGRYSFRPLHALLGLRLPNRSIPIRFPIEWIEVEYQDLK
jgi:hypothetical protein